MVGMNILKIRDCGFLLCDLIILISFIIIIIIIIILGRTSCVRISKTLIAVIWGWLCLNLAE